MSTEVQAADTGYAIADFEVGDEVQIAWTDVSAHKHATGRVVGLNRGEDKVEIVTKHGGWTRYEPRLLVNLTKPLSDQPQQPEQPRRRRCGLYWNRSGELYHVVPHWTEAEKAAGVTHPTLCRITNLGHGGESVQECREALDRQVEVGWFRPCLVDDLKAGFDRKPWSERLEGVVW